MDSSVELLAEVFAEVTLLPVWETNKKNLPSEASTTCQQHQAQLPIHRRCQRQETQLRQRQGVNNVRVAHAALAEKNALIKLVREWILM